MPYIPLGPAVRVLLDCKTGELRVEELAAPIPGFHKQWRQTGLFKSEVEWDNSPYSKVEMDDDTFFAITYFWIDLTTRAE